MLFQDGTKDAAAAAGSGASKKPRRKQQQQPASSSSLLNPPAQRLQPSGIISTNKTDHMYSAIGSIVEDASSEEEEEEEKVSYVYRGKSVVARLDRVALQQAVRKSMMAAATAQPLLQGFTTKVSEEIMNRSSGSDESNNNDDDNDAVSSNNKKPKSKASTATKRTTTTTNDTAHRSAITTRTSSESTNKKETDVLLLGLDDDDTNNIDYLDRDGASIFGQAANTSNSTWVECDKCKKWRRLRGVVDEKKLPSKWYCSMNSKNDPERARCSAPEEEYETPHTPESAADARVRKHLRIWVRRLQCNEAYEARQPTLTRGKKRQVASSSKSPYEWVRCCNPSCGKWRAILRIMDAKSSVVERTTNGEWYCVMNNWDEKIASCAAPQENLPAVGCPPWVMQD